MKCGRIFEAGTLPRKIDKKNWRILEHLSTDGRASLSSIAKASRLSRDAVSYRINRMKKEGIILGFIPMINLHAFGYQTFHVYMVINISKEKRRKELIDHIVNHPHTKSVMEYHDTWDLEWVLVAKNLEEFDNLIIQATKDFQDVVIRKDKLAIIKGIKSILLPGSAYTEIKGAREFEVIEAGQKIDQTDIKILQALNNDARQSTYDIAKQLDVSSDTVGYRIKKLIKNKVIYGFTVLVNLSALGYNWYTFCMNLRTFDKVHEMRFKEFMSQNDSILRAVKVLGDWDIVCYIVTENTRAFHLTYKQVQEQFMDIIYDSQIWIAYKEHMFASLPTVITDPFS